MSALKYIQKVAIVGATGRIGGAFASSLVGTGKHTVTALVRESSSGTVPTGAKPVKVDFEDESSLTSALRGQEFLVITLGVRAPKETHSRIVSAAGKAGVPFIMPNVYGMDFTNPGLQAEDLFSASCIERIDEVKAAGASYIAMACGFWHKWSLAMHECWFGFDIENKKVTFIDDGKTKINSSTWEQCGRALASLLSLPVHSADGSPAIEDWKNKPLYISSFLVSQRDMLDSLHRVMGTTDKDWTIRNEPSQERYKAGITAMNAGDFTGFAKAMYTRVFYPNGDGNFEAKHGLANKALGLPVESLDEETKGAVELVESGWDPIGLRAAKNA